MSELYPGWASPPSELRLPPDEIHVWRFSLDRSTSELESLAGTLANDELDRANLFYFERDRNRYIAGRGILRSILGLYLKISPANLRFLYGSKGKPVLCPEFTYGLNRVEFNLAHSANLALLAVGLNYPVGVDLEFVKTDFNYLELVERFFTLREIKAVRELPPSQQQEAFYNGWTRKEAFMKGCGDGLSVGLDQVEVELIPGRPARFLRIKNDRQLTACWSLKNIEPGPNYKAALAVEKPEFKLKCWDWVGSPLDHESILYRGPE